MNEDRDTATTTETATTGETDRAQARPRVAALVNSAATLATAIVFIACVPPKIPGDCGD